MKNKVYGIFAVHPCQSKPAQTGVYFQKLKEAQVFANMSNASNNGNKELHFSSLVCEVERDEIFESGKIYDTAKQATAEIFEGNADFLRLCDEAYKQFEEQNGLEFER